MFKKTEETFLLIELFYILKTEISIIWKNGKKNQPELVPCSRR